MDVRIIPAAYDGTDVRNHRKQMACAGRVFSTQNCQTEQEPLHKVVCAPGTMAVQVGCPCLRDILPRVLADGGVRFIRT